MNLAPELGLLALVTALVVTVVQSSLPIIATAKRDSAIAGWIGLARSAALTQFMLVAISYGCLTYAFITNNFSVAYVANHSNSFLPLIYKISGVWGGHEGSMLLWILTLSLWTAGVAIFTKNLPDLLVSRVLSVMGMISTGFLLFILFTSNPFSRILPAPLEGRDLNPLLQDIGLAIHPPMLYMGYVGFSVVFAFAVAALIGGRLDSAWARWCRPWTNVAWAFLTIGIALGSWWAYYELGWGGWWFWDPVENASFMPWLAGTALIHSLAATEKRGVFKAWTILLAMVAFSLSLLGTFLVRSGVLTSVHAFASDPERGLFILMFLLIVVGSSLCLYAWRAPKIISRVQFDWVSRESMLLLNNVFLCTLCFAVLLGTLYPLVHDALGAGKLSVGPPYFDFVFSIIGAPLVLILGIGGYIRWKKDSMARIKKETFVCLLVSVAIGIVWPFFQPHYSVLAALGLALGTWLVLSSLLLLWNRTNPGARVRHISKTPRSVMGMVIAHAGMGVFLIGVVFTNVYSVEKDIRMAPGDQYAIGQYSFEFNGIQQVQGPNYVSDSGQFSVKKSDQPLTQLVPEKRIYLVQKNPMTEAAIDAGFFRDLYVALGEPLNTEGAWAVRIYYKPYIRWIWLGALLMAFGGVWAVMDKRYRQRSRQPHKSESLVGAA